MRESALDEQRPEPDGRASGPLASGERLVTLDFIRGVAVLGILFPNIVAFANPQLAYYWPPGLPGGATAADGWMWLLQLVLIDGKLRGLFTILFGAGMMLFIERTAQRGHGLELQARRLFWLALFGLAHFYLFWTGDILFLYALSGFGLLATVRWPPRVQLWIGVAWYVATSLLFGIFLGWQAALEDGAAGAGRAPEARAELAGGSAELIAKAAAESVVMANGSLGDIIAYRWHQESLLADALFLAMLEAMPLMLIGMALYRLGLFEQRLKPSALRRWGWTGFLAGAALILPFAVYAWLQGFPLRTTQFAFSGAGVLFNLPMVIGLASLLSLSAPNAARTWLGERVVAAGRMAFSNYIGTSAVMMLAFQGWAGGLWGQMHRFELLAPVLLGWALMLGWSRPWLERFRYGPLEWLWRCLTYWRLFPLRR